MNIHIRSGTVVIRKEEGFTLIELLVATALLAVLATLGAGAARQFWLVRSLDAGADAAVSQLRRMQAQSAAESHPLIFGARFRAGSSEWTLVKFDPKIPTDSTDDVCTELGSPRTFDAGVIVASVDFSDVTGVTDKCRSQTSDEVALFYPRGTATAGSLVLSQPALGRTQTVTVTAITGRVTR